ncbi:hypothetical protein QBC47DRAFT_444925 [Echria macrotheca]|uniref:Uncharacterized protein n=1 Tax=Echria macrotheca TaxID=438768 RepID=A0AAJ0BGJ1_9PEZI|nr:hypothetical protein QBC47DRAFT_444925 [Echria macrotheca]
MAARFITLVATTLALGLSQGVAAADDTPQVQLLSGVCYDFAGAFQSDTGNAMVGDVILRPAGTGTFLDGLETGFGGIAESARMSLPWSTLAYFNETGRARYRITCRDEDGLAAAGSTNKPLKVNTDKDNTLVIDSYGLMLEPYGHYVDGQRVSGVFLGAAGVTRWAWGNVTYNGIPFWRPRLLVASRNNLKGDQLRAGEVGGYLMAASR